MISINSLEIFKQNYYIERSIEYVSNNAYLSIVVTNACQRKCFYCINSETDHSLELPIDKAIKNIKNLVKEYQIKEAILLGGEPLLHSDILLLIKRLRLETGLKFIRLTTNGIFLNNHRSIIPDLFNHTFGLQGINISFHNEGFISLVDLREIYTLIKEANSDVKVRINSNIWRGNLDNLLDLLSFFSRISFADEVRLSNIIPKDEFSVNPVNTKNTLILSNSEYDTIFNNLIKYYENDYLIIENKETLGFVRYVLIPKPSLPIIINWNINSTVSKQVCENNKETRQINTFKCLVSGNISLSWNEKNLINSLK